MQIRTGRRFCLCLAAESLTVPPALKKAPGQIAQLHKRNNNHITRLRLQYHFTGELRICR
jgi:hypothetical protein